jgi:hypothetical protein
LPWPRDFAGDTVANEEPCPNEEGLEVAKVEPRPKLEVDGLAEVEANEEPNIEFVVENEVSGLEGPVVAVVALKPPKEGVASDFPPARKSDVGLDFVVVGKLELCDPVLPNEKEETGLLVVVAFGEETPNIPISRSCLFFTESIVVLYSPLTSAGTLSTGLSKTPKIVSAVLLPRGVSCDNPKLRVRSVD